MVLIACLLVFIYYILMLSQKFHHSWHVGAIVSLSVYEYSSSSGFHCYFSYFLLEYQCCVSFCFRLLTEKCLRLSS